MKYNYSLILIIALCIYISYTNLQKMNVDGDGMKFAALVNEYVNNAQNRGSVTKQNLTNGAPNSPDSNKDIPEQTNILSDSSKIQTMYDGAGNKTETRCFNGHPRLTCIVLSTGVNGQRQAIAYGQNGDVKQLPQDMLDKVTTASGDEIANAVGIYAARPQKTQPENVQTTPVPAVPGASTEEGKSLIQNSPGKQSETERTTSDPANSKTNPTVTVRDNQPGENKESPASNSQIEEKK